MTLTTIDSDVNIANIIETRSALNPNINVTSANYYDKDGTPLTTAPSFVYFDVYTFASGGGVEKYDVYIGISDDRISWYMVRIKQSE